MLLKQKELVIGLTYRDRNNLIAEPMNSVTRNDKFIKMINDYLVWFMNGLIMSFGYRKYIKNNLLNLFYFFNEIISENQIAVLP